MLGLTAATAVRRSRTPQRETKKSAAGATKSSASAAKKEEEVVEGRDMRELITMVSKLALSATTKSDNALGMLLDVLLLTDEDCKARTAGPLSEKIREQLRLYAVEVKDASKEKRAAAGPPYVRAWDAVVTWAAALQEDEASEAVRQAVLDHINEVKEMQPASRIATIGLAVRFCKLSKTFNKGVSRLEVRVQDCEECKSAHKMWTLLRGHMISKLRADMRQGRAPPNALQRKTVEKMRELGMLENKDGMQQD
eukprot:TRINITY_DN18305_c0_g2_i1.p1 TRINITY_DN18305_c0_g2~~TRINITY_DN18305_c0_g2_i1.p1  ORF type:complete len:253 (+),score=83.94 TRINITY_DN18305_c0_g2_i1:240-998(+)